MHHAYENTQGYYRSNMVCQTFSQYMKMLVPGSMCYKQSSSLAVSDRNISLLDIWVVILSNVILTTECHKTVKY